MRSTGTLAPPDADAAAGSPRPRRRVLARALLAGLGLAAASAAGWWVEAGQRLDDVRVAAAPDAVTCRAGQVVPPRADAPLSTSDLAPAVVTAPGMACSVTLLVLNDGSDEVALDRLSVRGMGPSGGTSAQVLGVSPYGSVRTDAGGPGLDGAPQGYDAVVDLEDVLLPGRVQRVVLELAFRESVCNQAGGFVTPDPPLVEVSALGRSAARGPALPPFTLAGSSVTCDSAPRD